MIDPDAAPSWITKSPREVEKELNRRLKALRGPWWRNLPPIRISKWLALYLAIEWTLVPIGIWHVIHNWLAWL